MSGDVHVRFCERPGVRLPRATHLVIAFADEHDARRVAEVLPKRLGRFGLRLHPEKTRLVPFRWPPWGSSGSRAERPGSFDFLGFTHYWGKGRKPGSCVLKRKTAAKRLTRSMSRVRSWCRRWRHEPVAWQRRQLSRRLLGHYAYYGVIGNYHALNNFYLQVTREWRKWLDRRSKRKSMPWVRFNRLLGTHPLPRPRIAHSA